MQCLSCHFQPPSPRRVLWSKCQRNGAACKKLLSLFFFKTRKLKAPGFSIVLFYFPTCTKVQQCYFTVPSLRLYRLFPFRSFHIHLVLINPQSRQQVFLFPFYNQGNWFGGRCMTCPRSYSKSRQRREQPGMFKCPPTGSTESPLFTCNVTVQLGNKASWCSLGKPSVNSSVVNQS